MLKFLKYHVLRGEVGGEPVARGAAAEDTSLSNEPEGLSVGVFRAHIKLLALQVPAYSRLPLEGLSRSGHCGRE